MIHRAGKYIGNIDLDDGSCWVEYSGRLSELSRFIIQE